MLRQAGFGPPGPTAELVEARVGGDPVGPGGELGASVETGEPLDDGDERFLGGVEGVRVVAGQAPTYGMDSVLVPAQQLVEGALISGLSRLDERSIRELG